MSIFFKTHTRVLRITLIMLPLLVLGACESTTEMPRQVQGELAGIWKQTDGSGSASLRFYKDSTVMVKLPNRTPPLSFISSYGAMKDGNIGIASGSVWMGPITCVWKKGSKVMQVTIPDKKKAVLQLVKQ